MFKKGIFLLLLCSCAQNDNWTVDHIQTGNEAFSSSKLSFPTHDAVNGIDLEFLRVEGQLHTYLQVHSQAIPPYQGNPKEALVTLQMGETTFSGIAHRHEGGQRLLLSNPLQEYLLKALQDQTSVTIRLEGYKTVVATEQFLEHFAEFQGSPIRNHFQLPFKL